MTVTAITSESEISPTKWNKLAQHPLQSWEWGKARKAMGVPVLRFIEQEEDQPSAVFQLTLHRIPHTRQWVGYAPRTVMPTPELLAAIKAHTEHSIVFVNIEPIASPDADTPNELRPSSRTLMSSTQMFVDLTTPEEELMQRMKKNTRYSIRSATKKGVTIKEASNKKGLEAFIQLHESTKRRQGFGGRPPRELRTIWKHTQPMSRIWLAQYDTQIIAGAWMLTLHNTTYYVYAASDPKHRAYSAPSLLLWEIMQHEMTHGGRSMDLWGVLPKGFDSSHKWAGFTQFKEGFGGYREEYIGSLEYIIKPFWHRLYTIAHRFRTR